MGQRGGTVGAHGRRMCRAGRRARTTRAHGGADRETQWNVSVGGRVRGTQRMCVMLMGGGAVAPLFVCAQASVTGLTAELVFRMTRTCV